MHLTEQRLHDIAKEARAGLRDCLHMIALHDRSRQRSFLNPVSVLTAVASWERFVFDLIVAAGRLNWSITEAGWDDLELKTYPRAPWPNAIRPYQLDEALMSLGVLDEPLTGRWQVFVAADWFGADPTDWRLCSLAGDAQDDERNLLRQAILGAKSARDAAAHRLYFKKAHQAQGRKKLAGAANQADLLDWCYVWQSDNTVRGGGTVGRPTIQSGYARGAVALFVQLVDQTIAVVRQHHNWRHAQSRLPAEWFAPIIESGPFAGLAPWGSQPLHRFA